jgi:DNA-binding IclR family transcriptional regulator
MRALDRMLAVAEAVAASEEPARLTDLAARAGLTLPTTSRLLREMVDAGVVAHPNGSRGYVLGTRLVAIARIAADRNSIVDVALPEMEGLRDLTGETVSLHIPRGRQRVCIAEIQSTNEVRRVVPIGLSLPLHVGPTGRVLLAYAAEGDREQYLADADLSPGERKRLSTKLAEVARVGWDLSIDERTPGVGALTAPILARGTAVAALSVSGPSTRWTDSRIRESAALVVQSADRIGARAHGV